MASARHRRIRRHARKDRKAQLKANSLQHEVKTATFETLEVNLMIDGAFQTYHGDAPGTSIAARARRNMKAWR